MIPFPITEEDLERGRERFNIYCSPCHSQLGDGNGMIVQRGFKTPPSYHSTALRKAPDRTLLQRDDQRLGRDGGLRGAGSGRRPLAHRRLHTRAAVYPARHARPTFRPGQPWPAQPPADQRELAAADEAMTKATHARRRWTTRRRRTNEHDRTIPLPTALTRRRRQRVAGHALAVGLAWRQSVIHRRRIRFDPTSFCAAI